MKVDESIFKLRPILEGWSRAGMLPRGNNLGGSGCPSGGD